MKPYLIILSLLSLVVLGATADAVSSPTLSHTLQAVEVGGLLVVGLALDLKRRDIFALLITYICFRIVFFDYSYCLVAGLPLGYHGTSSLWDNFLSQFPWHGLLFARAVILIVGVSIPFKHI